MEPVLEIDNLTRRLDGGRHELKLTRPFTPLALATGDVLGVIGPFESGKSALLSCIVGLIPCEPGMIKICGRPPGPETVPLVGYIPAPPAVWEEFTCREYLSFFAEAYGMDLHYRPYLVREALRLVRMQSHADTAVSQITSYALRRRLGVARALVHNPRLVVMDDCLARLDRREAREMVSILRDIRNTGKTLVLSSPSLSELSALCSHLCILVTYEPLACGEVSKILHKIQNLRMMQIQVHSGVNEAVSRLRDYNAGVAGAPRVFHLMHSSQAHNLVRFLFDGSSDDFDRLLNHLTRHGVPVVSYAEDHSFLGNVGAP
jgi:ABC-2 type transport system ATP-binding protein